MIQWTPPIQQGWECPRCYAINAPHMPQCTCGRATTQTITTTDTAPGTAGDEFSDYMCRLRAKYPDDWHKHFGEPVEPAQGEAEKEGE